MDTVLKLIYTLDASSTMVSRSNVIFSHLALADSASRSIDGQLQRMRHSSFQLLPILSRDELFRHLLGQIDSTHARQVVSATYWRVCFYVLAMAIRLVHQSNFILVRRLSQE